MTAHQIGEDNVMSDKEIPSCTFMHQFRGFSDAYLWSTHRFLFITCSACFISVACTSTMHKCNYYDLFNPISTLGN